MPPEGTEPDTATPTGSPSVVIEPEREIRFAVVMYGGVSLAIYINGVAQELLNMVRATAPSTADPSTAQGQEAATASVYRELAKYLDQRDGFNGNDGVIHTRFVVDVISGTSAGGINGVFLAKALARDQNMEGLKKLWLSEGDLNKLLNDSVSVSDLAGFAVQKPLQSLLNSQRTDRKLLEALEQMAIPETGETQGEQKESERETRPSPLVSELDLFITTTDLEGLPLPISLSDEVVYERRYRNVFHFRYHRTRDSKSSVIRVDDFKRASDPFLAYAARCTSSFPFAFEPMCLADIVRVTENYPRYRNIPAIEDEPWDGFFDEYLRLGLYDIDKRAREEVGIGLAEFAGDANEKIRRAKAKLRQAFWSRSFGDGGYLDNKPFSYATSTLMRRPSGVVHVERKLVYVEPSPEHPELAPENRERPDFAANVRAALLELPRQETIREDIERIYERNQTIARLITYTRELDSDIEDLGLQTIEGGEFADADVNDMIAKYKYGASYGAYHRLRVGEVTSFLAATVARAKGHDPFSDAAEAVRQVVAAWRDSNYKPNKKDPDPDPAHPRATENRFLVDFDAEYRLRRVIFLIRRINELARYARSNKSDLLGRLKRMLGSSFKAIKQQHERKGIREELDSNLYDTINQWLHASDPPTKEAPVWLDGFVTELQRIKKTVLSDALDRIRAFLETPLIADNPGVIGLLGRFDLTWPQMKEILDSKGALRSASATKHVDAFKPLADTINSELVAGVPFLLVDAIKDCASIPPEPASSKTGDPARQHVTKQAELAGRLWLIDCAENFARYDMISFPIEYGTGAGEANIVDVFRISPEDATSLIDERRVGEERRKLAGRALMSFGAFLDRGWRKNDMLWGRLDGARAAHHSAATKKDRRRTQRSKP
jgi:patatin-related protein